MHFQEDLHIRDYLHVLRRRRDIVIIFFVTTVLLVTIGSFIMPPVYRATVTLLIDVESPNVLTTSGTVALENQNYFSYKEYYQSQKELITSLTILRKVFEEFNLARLSDYATAKEPVKKFAKTITVEPVRDTRLLRLHVDNKDPALAAQLANRIAELYVMRNLYYISKNELLNLLKNEYLKLETKLAEYSKIYKEAHPEMIRLKKEMAEMVDKIEAEKKAALSYDAGTGGIDSSYFRALEGLKANNVSIQDAAEKPVVPLRPKKLVNIMLAIVIGFCGGIALAFFFEYFDDTVNDIEDVERLTHWPFLGSVPKMDGAAKMSEDQKDIFSHLKPKDPVAEAYRSLRTSLIFSSTAEAPIKAVVVTSPGPQEGKTTTLVNLAIVMAQVHKKVLVVDADMRKPRLHDIFKKKNDVGLSNFLCGQVGLDMVVQQTDIENLFVVPSGLYAPNPAELLAGSKMRDFIQKAKAQFDCILFDLPPMAFLTDAVILANITDGVIVVAESGKTSRRILMRMTRLLQDAKSRVIGIVLNKLSIYNTSYYYYSYYGKQ